MRFPVAPDGCQRCQPVPGGAAVGATGEAADEVTHRLLTLLEKELPAYLAQHEAACEPGTINTLRQRLKHATAAFGEVALIELQSEAVEITKWRSTLPEGSRYGIVQALRQTLEAAVRWGHIDRNPAKLAGVNPQPKRREITPFTREEIDALAVELGPWGPLAVFASETGLRPSEWIALEWRDVDRGEAVVLVQRTFSRGVLNSYGKTAHSRRRVPLSKRALDALEQRPRRINSRLLPCPRWRWWRCCWSWRPSRPPQLAGTRLERCARRRRYPEAPHLRSPTHVRNIRAGGRDLDLRTQPLYGHERGDDRQDVRPSSPRLGDRGEPQTRCAGCF